MADEEFEPVKHYKAPSKGGDVGMFGEHPISRIMFKGIFDWEGLYHFIKRWFAEHDYKYEEGVFKSNSSGDIGKEQEFKWKGQRKVTEYYKYKIKLEMHSWDMRPVEVVEKGKKKKRWKGKFMLEFYADLETDYQGWWKKSQFALNIKRFLDRFVWKKERMFIYADQLYYSVQRFQSEVKVYLKMHSKGNAYKDSGE